MLYDLKSDHYQLHPITEESDVEGLLPVFDERLMHYIDIHEDERFRAVLNQRTLR